MTLTVRKLTVIGLIGTVFLVANAWFVVNWLADEGVIEWAVHIRKEFITGTAITVIVALLILLVQPRGQASGWIRRCPVCEHRLIGRGKYCSDCGSKL